jgi:hypothetical protein
VTERRERCDAAGRERCNAGDDHARGSAPRSTRAAIADPTGIGDGWIAVQDRDFATGKRLGRAFAGDLRLITTDLGATGR